MTSARDAPRPRREGRARLVLVALLALGAAALGARSALRWWVGRDHVVGIDVSHHQGAIDWERVRAGGIGFAFIKATEGATFVDRTFASHWARARAAGLPRGAYHFFTFCTAGRDQAANFIATVPVDESALPPVVDLEFGGNCARVDGIERPTDLDAFRGRTEDLRALARPAR